MVELSKCKSSGKEKSYVLKIVLFFYFILLSLLAVLHCSKPAIEDYTVVAQIGDKKITARDFRISYELAPPGSKINTKDNNQKKIAYLNSMVEAKLLSLAGDKLGLDEQEDVQIVLRWHEREAVIRELYREMVQKKVQVSELETRDGYIKLNQRLVLRQILLNSVEEAYQLYSRFQKGDTFEQIALDIADSEPRLQRMLSSREFQWGELDERLETAAFGLNLNEISAPIKSEVGFHLIQLLNRKENLILTEGGYQNRQHYVETVIRRRKEADMAKNYAKTVLEKMKPQANGPVLRELTDIVKSVIREKKIEKPVPPYAQSRIAKEDLKSLWNKELVIYEGGSWTVKEFLGRIEKMPPTSRPDLTLPASLTNHLAAMVRDEFMAQEGYERSLNYREPVTEEMNRIRETILAQQMKKEISDTIEVSREEIEMFFRENLSRYQIPEQVKIQEIMVRNKELADSLLNLIHNGRDIGVLARKYSVRKWAAQNDGIIGYFTKEAFANIGKEALGMEIGRITGPLPVKIQNHIVGYSIFKLLDKRPQHTPKIQEVYRKVSQEALKEKKNKILNTYIHDIKEQFPVHTYTERLKDILTIDETGTGRPMDLVIVRP